MTRKECLLEIMKDGVKMTSTEICNKFYELYPDMIEQKRHSYIIKGKIMSEKDLWIQFRAELINYCINKNSIRQIKENKKIFYILDKVVETYITLEIIEQKQTKEPKEEREVIYQMTNEELGWKCLNVYKDGDHIDFDITSITEYTYVFDDNTPILKIGKTSQETPKNRLDQFLTGNPSIHIDIVFPATLYKEKFLHEKFSDFRQQTNREWFYKVQKLSDFIEEHKNKNGIVMDSYKKYKELKDIEKQIINW